MSDAAFLVATAAVVAVGVALRLLLPCGRFSVEGPEARAEPATGG